LRHRYRRKEFRRRSLCLLSTSNSWTLDLSRVNICRVSYKWEDRSVYPGENCQNLDGLPGFKIGDFWRSDMNEIRKSWPPAEPEACRLLAPRRGLIANEKITWT
jgi:hypothetical protein